MDYEEEYRKGKEIAKQNGINLNTYKFRVQSGWTIEQASTYTKPYTRVRHGVRGKGKKKSESYVILNTNREEKYCEKTEIITYRTKKKEWIY